MVEPPDNRRYVLTGPSGWIGRAMLSALAAKCGRGAEHRVSAFASQAGSLELPSGERFDVRPLTAITPGDVDGAHVIHLAYLTKEKAEQLGTEVFAATNDAIDDAVLAALGESAPASLFVASSGAAALAECGTDSHPYGLAKLRQEMRFLEWAARSGVPTIAGRIFNLAGPYINKLRSYAISDFALQAHETGEIHIEATVPVFRSYLHVGDLCSLVLGAGAQGVCRRTPIDLCGTEMVEMEDIAAMVATASHGSPSIHRRRVDFTRASRYLGDSTHTKVLAMELGHPLRPLSVQVAETIAWLRQFTAREGERAA